MKILMVSTDFKPNAGGIAEFGHQMARYFHAFGHEVLVLAPDVDGMEAFRAGVAYAVQPFSRPKSRGRIERMFARRSPWDDVLARGFRALQPDLVFVVLYYDVGLPVLRICQRRHVPYCLCAHGREIVRPYQAHDLRHVFLPVFRGATRIFCNSDYTRRRVVQRGVDDALCEVIHSGVDLADYPEPAYPEQASSTLKLFALSRLVPRKGLDSVIVLLHQYADDLGDVAFRIAGRGPDEPRLRSLVERHGLTDKVTFLGFVTDAQKAEEYADCDIFIMPCRETDDGDVEGFGLVFLEANACGRPVVAGRSGGVEAAVADGVSGILVDPENLEDIARAIMRLKDNLHYRNELGRAGRKRVEDAFTWEKVARKYEQSLPARAREDSRTC